MKYVNYEVTFAEVPEEITLCINISNCPCKCVGCHSSYLWDDVGEELTSKALKNLITKNNGISCVAFMGGDSAPNRIYELCKEVKLVYHLKTAWYSGRQSLPNFLLDNSQKLSRYDYIKLGPYIEERGPLNNPNTNQILYKVENNRLVDITNKFWKHD